MIPVSALAIIGFASGNGLIESTFSIPIFVALGEASYAVYLIHIPLWHYVIKMHLDQNNQFFPFYILTVIVLSLVCFYWFERPMRSSILRWSATSSKETIVESSMAQ